jgi:hypothetical protein
MTAALVAFASPVFAGSYVSTWDCKYSRFYGTSHCGSSWTEVADPVRDPQQERLDAIARAGRRQVGGVLQTDLPRRSIRHQARVLCAARL